MTQPAAGAQRVIYSFAHDPPVAKNKTHGISSKSSLEVSDYNNMNCMYVLANNLIRQIIELELVSCM